MHIHKANNINYADGEKEERKGGGREGGRKCLYARCRIYNLARDQETIKGSG